MTRRARRQWRELRDRLFPERQIIFRSRGDVRYVALSSRAQIAMATSIVAFAGWIGYASVNVFYRDAMLDARDRRITELSYAYERLAADYEKSQENFVVASRDLEERYRRLYDMAMKQRSPALPTDTASAGQASAPAKITEPNKTPRPTAAEPSRAPEAKGEVKVATATPSQPSASASSDDPSSIEDLEGMLRESKARPPLPAVKPRDIETRILAVRGQQRELIDDLGARTDKSVALLEKALGRTGLDISAMLSRALEARADVGVGGPLRALNVTTPGATGVAVASVDPQADRDINNLEGKFGRWGDLLALAQRLPLDLPMSGEAEVSSTYGRRTDPFTKQPAFHAGIDFIGPNRAPVVSTAPGVVVFAGRKGPYGRAVEIDHGLGVKTRYAHLSTITVQAGETVPFGRQLGTMGSTGRSTGQHLHYEILLDDEQIDPGKFIEAGYHVFKQQENQSAGRR
ncbi:M23 family metallopeptidase [Ferrovibrio terrae]|uniref:M23 family metallopeptidase n=1 Tax=Ferrovibrio terrae TaxID=2594003 RepID=A0A516H3D9_9PROT|nr:M23 family metallopeptidase [Ferrovibrio terrae]QDO98289.1 M23 family metallopeptidase [Ferrovibrio terrae]